jgi:UDP-2,4-diacetamido-2,4,6-trideoxy-beta-L-altropyranose hydrolase
LAIGWSCSFVTVRDTVVAFPQLLDSPHEVVLIDDYLRLSSKIELPIGKVDLLVVDHYSLDLEFEVEAREWAEKICVLEDLPNRKHECDFLLDQTLGRSKQEYLKLVGNNCKLLLGPKYALLRPEFGVARQCIAVSGRNRSCWPKRVLVAIGGSDPRDLTSTALRAIKQSGLDLRVDVVLGAASPNLQSVSQQLTELGENYSLHIDTVAMASLMSRADVAIGACGVTSWERCCVGLPTIAVVIAENQRQIAKSLAEHGAIIYAGDWTNVSCASLSESLVELLSSASELQKVAAFASSVCDGRGAGRTIKRLTENG